MTGTSGREGLRLGQQFQTTHARHVDVRQDEDERRRSRLRCDASAAERIGKLHGEPVSAEIAPELLTEKCLDVRLIVDDENERVRAFSRILASDAPHAAARFEIR